jgi:hypothetical protein
MMASVPHASRAGAISVSTSEAVERFEPRRETRRRGRALAERASLEVVGFVFAAVTAMVMVIAVLVVWSHVTKNAAGQGSLAAPATMAARR